LLPCLMSAMRTEEEEEEEEQQVARLLKFSGHGRGSVESSWSHFPFLRFSAERVATSHIEILLPSKINDGWCLITTSGSPSR